MSFLTTPSATRTSSDAILRDVNANPARSDARKLEIENLLAGAKGQMTEEQINEFRGIYSGAGSDLTKLNAAFDVINTRMGDIRKTNAANRQALDEQVKLLQASPGARLQQNKVTAFFGATGAQGALRGALAGNTNPTGNSNG